MLNVKTICLLGVIDLISGAGALAVTCDFYRVVKPTARVEIEKGAKPFAVLRADAEGTTGYCLEIDGMHFKLSGKGKHAILNFYLVEDKDRKESSITFMNEAGTFTENPFLIDGDLSNDEMVGINCSYSN